MKKILCILLTLTIVLGLCACGGTGGSGEKKREGLHAGYSRQSIMPDGPVGLGGYSNSDTRKSNGFLDYVYATCVAFSSGEDTLLMFMFDTCGFGLTKELRALVSKETGVPEAHITTSASHTHAGPVVDDSPAYQELVFKQAVTAAKEALADLSPAVMYGANIQTENMNYIRHYKQQDGSITSANLSNLDLTTVVGHAREPDRELVMIRAEREGDKEDIVIMNFAAHPCFTGGSSGTVISSDYIGSFRDTFEQETGMHFAFLQGGAGDGVTSSEIKEIDNGYDWREYGAALTKYAVDALPTMKKVEDQTIKISQNMFTYAANHYGEDQLEDAQRVMEFYNTDRTKATALAKSLGFYSINHAKGIVRAYNNPDELTAELDAFSIGGIGFVTVPGEVFAQTAMHVKDNSPFEYTVFCELTNGGLSYMPIKEAYEYPSYEGFVAKFGKGFAEAFSEELITMLKSFQ